MKACIQECTPKWLGGMKLPFKVAGAKEGNLDERNALTHSGPLDWLWSLHHNTGIHAARLCAVYNFFICFKAGNLAVSRSVGLTGTCAVVAVVVTLRPLAMVCALFAVSGGGVARRHNIQGAVNSCGEPLSHTKRVSRPRPTSAALAPTLQRNLAPWGALKHVHQLKGAPWKSANMAAIQNNKYSLNHTWSGRCSRILEDELREGCRLSFGCSVKGQEALKNGPCVGLARLPVPRSARGMIQPKLRTPGI